MAYFQDDQFNDGAIGDFWTETTTSGGSFSESGGLLTVTSGQGLIWTYPPWSGDISAINWLHQDNISGDFCVVLKISSITGWPEWDGFPDQPDTRRGLVVKVANDTFAVIYLTDYLTTVEGGWNVSSKHVNAGVFNSHGSTILDVFPTWSETFPLYFKIARISGLFRSYFSVDGREWYEFPHTVPLNNSSDVSIGVFANHAVTQVSMDVDYFIATFPPIYSTVSLSIILSLKNADLLNVVENAGLLYPIARVTVLDLDTNEEYEIGDVASFSVSMSGDPTADSFSLTVRDNETWYKRGDINPDILAGQVNRRIKLELGYLVDEVEHYIPVFVGVPRKDNIRVTPEEALLNISGEGLERALLLTDGSFGAWTGTAKELIAHILASASLTEYSLSFEDQYIDGITFNYANAYGALTGVVLPLGNMEFFFDQQGVFVVQQHGIVEDTVYTLSGELQLTSVLRATDASKIITYVDVTGADDDSSTIVQTTAAMLAKYGVNKKVYSSSLLTTLAAAQAYGENVIAETSNWEDSVDIDGPFIPYLRPGSKIVVTDTASDLNAATVRVKSLGIRFSADDGISTTSITGFVE